MDIRSSISGVRKYEDLHTEEITHVSFHPEVESRAFSSSVDGLICCVNTLEQDPQNGLEDVINVEESVNHFGFFGACNQFMYSLSSTERFVLWGLNNFDRFVDYGDVRAFFSQQPMPLVEYLIDCEYSEDQLFLFAGNFGGDFVVISVEAEGLRPKLLCSGGHKEIIRSVVSDLQSRWMITAGEDSRFCLWALS